MSVDLQADSLGSFECHAAEGAPALYGASSIDGEKSSGTFYYENRKLVCDFGDPNNIMIYRLDVERQQIDAGNGMLMTKE